MKLYLVMTTPEINYMVDPDIYKKTKVLHSFAYYKTYFEWIKNFKENEVIMDSGAFTAYNTDTIINIEEYAQFIKDTNCKNYFNLDVIGNAKASYNNFVYLSKYFDNIVPVFHFMSDKKYLFKYMDMVEYIGLGNLVPYSQQKTKLIPFFNFIFKEIRNNFKIHCLGISSMQYLTRFPFYSVDSSTWLQGARSGNIYKFDGMKIKDNRLQYNTIKLESDGKNNRRVRSLRLEENIEAFLQYEKYITELWKKRGVTWDD